MRRPEFWAEEGVKHCLPLLPFLLAPPLRSCFSTAVLLCSSGREGASPLLPKLHPLRASWAPLPHWPCPSRPLSCLLASMTALVPVPTAIPSQREGPGASGHTWSQSSCAALGLWVTCLQGPSPVWSVAAQLPAPTDPHASSWCPGAIRKILAGCVLVGLACQGRARHDLVGLGYPSGESVPMNPWFPELGLSWLPDNMTTA